MISVAMTGSAKTVRLFTVGNSFADNAVKYLGDIASAGGDTLIRGNATIAGGSLSNHWTAVEAFLANPNDPLGKPYSGSSLSELLAGGTWDVVTIQQASDYSASLDSYRPYATNLYNYIKQYAPGAEIVFHQTWAYRSDASVFPFSTSQANMHSQIRSNVQTIAGELGIRIIPVGDAFAAVRNHPSWPAFTRDPNFDYVNPTYPNVPTNESPELHVGFRWKTPTSQWIDVRHANQRGEYLGAAVFYEVLFGASVVGNSFVPSDATPFGYTPDEITTNEVVFFQGIVHDIVSASTSNQAPVAINQNVDVPANSAVNLVLTASDYGNPVLTYSIVNSPTHGTLSGLNATTGAITYTPATGYVGADSFTFSASDGSLSSTGTVSITVLNPTVVNVQYQIAASADDAWTSTNAPAYINTKMYFPYSSTLRIVFLRWALNIPAGATIISADLQVKSAGTKGDSNNSTVRLQLVDSDNTAGFTTLPYYLPVTATTADWVLPGAWVTNQWYTSGDIKTLVQQFVNRPGYASGNYLGLRCSNLSGSWKEAYQWNNGTNTDGAILRVTYQLESSDRDGDGIPDSWETLYFGGSTNAVASTLAANGVNTILETYIAGLDPTNALSTLTVVGRPSQAQTLLQWGSVSGRVYSVFWTTNLLNGFQPLETNIAWPQSSWTDAVHGAENEGFYRINVQLNQ